MTLGQIKGKQFTELSNKFQKSYVLNQSFLKKVYDHVNTIAQQFLAKV